MHDWNPNGSCPSVKSSLEFVADFLASEWEMHRASRTLAKLTSLRVNGAYDLSHDIRPPNMQKLKVSSAYDESRPFRGVTAQ